MGGGIFIPPRASRKFWLSGAVFGVYRGKGSGLRGSGGCFGWFCGSFWGSIFPLRNREDKNGFVMRFFIVSRFFIHFLWLRGAVFRVLLLKIVKVW